MRCLLEDEVGGEQYSGEEAQRREADVARGGAVVHLKLHHVAHLHARPHPHAPLEDEHTRRREHLHHTHIYMSSGSGSEGSTFMGSM